MARRIGRRELLRGAAGAGALTVSAAGGRTAWAQETPAANAELSGTVRYQLLAAGPGELEGAQGVIDELFRPRFPNVEVRVEPAPDNRGEKLVAAMIAGDAPDLFDTWLEDVQSYASRGQVLDVAPLVARDLSPEEIADFHAWQWADFELAGGLRFGLPKYVNMGLLWFNKDAFDEAGLAYPDETWDHDVYAEAARALTRRDGDNVERFGVFLPLYQIDRLNYKVRAFGGDVVDPNDDTRCALGDEPAQAGAEWVRKLIFDDGAGVDVTLLFGGEPAFQAIFEAFAAGTFAMAEDGLYPVAVAEAVGDAFRWGYAPIPRGPARRATFGTADGFAAWAGTANPEASWALMKFLAGPEYQAHLARTTGLFPARASVAAGWQAALAEAYPTLAEAGLEVPVRAMEEGYPDNRRPFRRDQEAMEIIGPALQKVYIVGDAPVTYFAEIAEQVTAAMREE